MPIPAAAAIGAGGSILETGINAIFTGSQNKKNRQWQEKMYNLQRANALADWQMQNYYNSPEQQMKRLIAAGLNPNLVYDNGATHSAAPVRSSDVGNYRGEAPQVSLAGLRQAGMDIYEINLKKAQEKALIASEAATNQDAALKAAQVQQTVANTDRSKFELGQAQRLADTAVAQAQANLEQTQTQTGIALNQDERAAAMNAQSITESVERVLAIRKGMAKTDDERREIQSRINSIDKDTELKKLDIELRRKGINPNDPIYLRILGRIVEKFLSGDWNLPDWKLRR